MTPQNRFYSKIFILQKVIQVFFNFNLIMKNDFFWNALEAIRLFWQTYTTFIWGQEVLSDTTSQVYSSVFQLQPNPEKGLFLEHPRSIKIVWQTYTMFIWGQEVLSSKQVLFQDLHFTKSFQVFFNFNFNLKIAVTLCNKVNLLTIIYKHNYMQKRRLQSYNYLNT